MFKGLSVLRAGEKEKEPVSEKSKALQQYLAAQYGGGGGDPEKKKKKKKKRLEAGGAGIKILDEDVSGFAPAGKAAAATDRAVPMAVGGDEDDEDEGGQLRCRSAAVEPVHVVGDGRLCA